MGTRPPLKLAGGRAASTSDKDWSQEAHAALRATFGFDAFRGHQLEAVQAALNGRDCFVLMPTGGGKSLCYSLLPAIQPGLVLVVSPLIALMQDQSLRARGLRAAYLSSSLGPAERQRLMDDLQQRRPATQLLFATPELLVTEGFRRCLAGLYAAGSLRLAAVDEAHCISDLGHDFRPAYRQLGAVRRELPRLPLMALTATASAAVQADVIRQLGLRSPLTLAASFNRPNISYQVRYLDLMRDSEGRPLASPVPDIVALLAAQAQRGGGSGGGPDAAPACAIVYCHKREEVDETAAALQARGLPAAAYHAGLPEARRAAVLSDWRARRLAVVVATVAFGMGIDRGDVRCVVHHSLPASLEAFYQEAGRAGRDGQPATSVVYFGRSDCRRRRFLLGAEEQRRQRQGRGGGGGGRDPLRQFERVISYCLSASCRRAAVLQHFGEAPPPRPVGVRAAAACCDVCADAAAVAAQLSELAAAEQRQQRQGHSRGGLVEADSGPGGDSGPARDVLEFERSWAPEGLDFDQEGPSRALSDSGSDGIEESDDEAAAAAAAVHRARALSRGACPGRMLAALERAEEAQERQRQQGSKRARLMHRLEGGGGSGGGGSGGGGGQHAGPPPAAQQAAVRQLAAVLGANPALAACVAGREGAVAAALVQALVGGGPSEPVFRSKAANLALQLRKAEQPQHVPALAAALQAAEGGAAGGAAAGMAGGAGPAAAPTPFTAAAREAAGSASAAQPAPGPSTVAEPLRRQVAEAARLAATAASGDVEASVAAAVGALRRLQDAPITAQLLQLSGAGRQVHRLSKHGVPAVAAAAASVERAWRSRLAAQQG